MFKRRVVETALKKKGFHEKPGDHKYFIYYTQDGMKTSIRTKISHGSGNRDIGPELLKRMARQCRLTAEDFVDLVKYPLDRRNYENKLQKVDAI